ncbi:MAG: DMT family transporter [Rhodoferax sp.]|nr:DMT family transporter [Rhodoferax sp.]
MSSPPTPGAGDTSLLAAGTARNRRIGIALMCGVAFSYSSIEVVAKYLVLTLPVLQVVWLRFLTHAVLGTLVLAPQYGLRLFQVNDWRLQIARGVMVAVMTVLNIWALVYLQLDITGAIQFTVPILVAVISAQWLGERLDARRWIAILAGFGGVLLIVRPGSQAFHPAIFLSIGNAILYALFNLLTRRLAATELPAATQLMSAIIATVLLTPVGLAVWKMPQGWLQWLLVLSLGVLGNVGHMMTAHAHRYASAAVLGPFIYQQVIYWGFFGWLVFDHVPDLMVVLGTAVIIGSGLYLLLREFRSE